ANPAQMGPGGDLVLHRSDGSEDVLVAGGNGAVTDPYVGFDATTGYYSYCPDLRPPALNSPPHNHPVQGRRLSSNPIPTKTVKRLTHQEFTPDANTGSWDIAHFTSTNSGKDTLGYGVLNLSPVPVAGGRIMFTSSRNGLMPTRAATTINLQLFTMNADGSD